MTGHFSRQKTLIKKDKLAARRSSLSKPSPDFVLQAPVTSTHSLYDDLVDIDMEISLSKNHLCLMKYSLIDISEFCT